MALDTFAGAAGALTDPWSKDGGASAMQRDGSGNARAGANMDAEYMVYTGSANSLAQECRVVAAAGIGTGGSSNYIGPMVRYGGGKGFLLASSPTEANIYVTRHTSGNSGPDLATRTHPSGGMQASNELKLAISPDATNPTLKCILNGVQLGADVIWTGTDAAIGAMGMNVYRGFGTAPSIAEWEGIEVIADKATRFIGSLPNYASRTAGVLDHREPYTWAAWVKINEDRDTYGHIFSIAETVFPASNYDMVGLDADGVTLRCGIHDGTDETSVTGTTLTVGTWYHLALKRESDTSLKVFVNGVLDITNTQDVSGRAAPMTAIVGALHATSDFDAHVDIYASKEWDVALSDAEIDEESVAAEPARTANLRQWSFLYNGLGQFSDSSGNGYDWTVTGPLTFVDPPDVPFNYEGSGEITGTGTVVLPALSISGSATAPAQASGTVVLPALSVTGSGTSPVAGQGTVVLPALSVSGEGEIPVSGEGTVSLPSLEVVGSGLALVSGGGIVALPGLEVSGSGKVSVRGSGTVVLPALEVSGGDAGIRVVVGEVTLPSLSVFGLGTIRVAGDGSVVLPALIVSGVGGTVPAMGIGSVVLPALVVSGEVVAPIRVNGSTILPALVVSGSGKVIITGTATLILPALVVSGLQTVPETFQTRGLVGINRMWPHNLYIVRPGNGTGGHFNEDDEWVKDDGTPLVVYNWGADVQDEGRTIQRTPEGLPSLRSDAVAFLRDERKIDDIQIGDPVIVNWEDGDFDDAEVIRVSKIDASLDLSWL